MDAADSKVVVKLLPNLADFAFLTPIVLLFGRLDGLHRLLSDADTGWHIRAGQWMLAHHAVPYRDFFSYSKPGGEWFAWEWLSDVLFAGLHNLGGLAAVGLFAVLLLALIFTLVFRLASRKSNPVLAVMVTVLAIAGSSIHWLARPHLFTLLFAAVFLNALDRVRAGQTRWAGIPWLVVLPVLTVLWTNLHGGFAVGVSFIAIYGVAELLQLLLVAQPEGRAAGMARARNYFLSALACMAASLLNPYTYHLHVHIWKYMADPFLSQHIIEYFTMSFHQPMAPFFEAMLAGGVLAAAWSLGRGSFAEPLLFVMWAHLGLLYYLQTQAHESFRAPAVTALRRAEKVSPPAKA